MDQVKKFFQLIGQHKGKFVLMIFSAVVFAVLLFPFSDLGDLVSSQVSKMTNNQVYLQFDKLRMSLFPETGVALDEVYLEAQAFPPLKSRELVFTPSVSSLINQKPAGTVALRGFLNGDVEASLKPGLKTENGIERQKVTLNAKKLSLAQLRELAQLPVMIKGNLDVDSQALADFTFQEQPDMDVVLKIDKFELPPATVQTMMGPITLPDLKLSAVELKGRLSAGRFQIEEGVIGKSPDEINGTIKGGIALTIQNRNGQMAPIVGAYDFAIDLNIKKGFQDRAALFLSFVDQFKTPTADGARYAFKLNATSPQLPPSMSALR